MILQKQAKVHVVGKLGVSTCIYPIFSQFEATFWSPPPHDEVIVLARNALLAHIMLSRFAFIYVTLLALTA